MDPALEHWLQRHLDAPLVRHQPVGGGCIHSAWCLELADGRRLFAKTNRATQLPLLEAEADGLQALAGVAPPALQVPQPLAWGCAGEQAVLVMNWLALGRGPGNEGWQQLGRSLAQLHRRSLVEGPGQGRFGWDSDNFIGASSQPNGWLPSWGAFFVQRRLEHQLRLAAAAGLRFSGGQRLLELASAWLANHPAEPVIVHGDLWSGNAGLLEAGGAALFDPAIYRGDREVDLAMARLFGGFPAAFFAGYQKEWPLAAGFAERQELYNLYHLLNHANLFGGGYVQQAQQSIKALLSRGIPCAASESC